MDPTYNIKFSIHSSADTQKRLDRQTETEQ